MKPEVYWIPCPWPGRLAIMPRPRGGDWLPDEIRGWKDTGLDTVVSMLTAEEVSELDLTEEAAICRQLDIAFVSFPVPDREIPPSRGSAQELLHQLAKKIEAGHNLGIHCRMGLGRSAMVVAAILVLAGVDPETAFRDIAKSPRIFSAGHVRAEELGWPICQGSTGRRKIEVQPYEGMLQP